ncbi:MAG TPA: hypothetical protein VLE19_13875, partial [Pyrinomonadaceae bacterium]|nr:hypothetical protein [Pyrinomonadaceae bacterium]
MVWNVVRYARDAARLFTCAIVATQLASNLIRPWIPRISRFRLTACRRLVVPDVCILLPPIFGSM